MKKRKIKVTPLSKRDYPAIRGLWTVQDMIRDLVNREAEVMVQEKPRELRAEVDMIRKPWGKVMLAAFTREVIGLGKI